MPRKPKSVVIAEESIKAVPVGGPTVEKVPEIPRDPTPAIQEIKKPRPKKDRTEEQIAADKERMKLVRAAKTAKKEAALKSSA